MNKILVRLYVPIIEEQYDLWIPLNKRIHNVIHLLTKAINDFTDGYYQPNKTPNLYDKLTAEPYDVNLTVKESTIRNGSEIIMI